MLTKTTRVRYVIYMANNTKVKSTHNNTEHNLRVIHNLKDDTQHKG